MEMSEEPESRSEAPDVESMDDEFKKIKERISNLDDYEVLVFNDRLYSVDEDNQKDGNYLVDVGITQDARVEGPCYAVEATAEGRVSGLRWSLRLTATVAAKTLETLTQTLVEKVEAGLGEDAGNVVKTTTIERLLSGSEIGLKETTGDDPADGESGGGEDPERGEGEAEDGEEPSIKASPNSEPLTYRIVKTTKHGEEEEKEEKSLSGNEATNFISEGANIILLRFLVKLGLASVTFPLQLSTIDPNLNLVNAIYNRIKDKKEVVGVTEVELVGVERTVCCPGDVKVTTNCFFFPSAHLAVRQQLGSPTIVKILSLPAFSDSTIPEEGEEEKKEDGETAENIPEFEKKELNWEEDMMLFSKYLDRKEELKASHQTYIRHHPELKCLLADFLQQLLLRKPEQVLPFADDFFTSFSLEPKG